MTTVPLLCARVRAVGIMAFYAIGNILVFDVLTPTKKAK